MQNGHDPKKGRTLAVLHAAMVLTGVVQAIGGPLLPSLAFKFHLTDSQSGALFFLYFAGTSLGAFFCRKNYARAITLGFVAMAACSVAVAWAGKIALAPAFLALGISNGMPMTGVSLFVGRAYPDRCAPILTFLNFSWSAGALLAPLLAARALEYWDYRAAYVLVACAAALAAIVCGAQLRDHAERPRTGANSTDRTALRLILVFAFAAFLQVGIENTSATWLSTYALRTTGSGIVLAAAASSLYWVGFLASRGFASLVLLRTAPAKVFRVAVGVALGSALILAVASSSTVRSAAMILLGVALAPIYPLVIAGFFAQARRTGDSRWVLATAGFGGSVLPWLAGWLSTHAGGLKVGILTIPAALLLMVLVLPAVSTVPSRIADNG